MIVEVALCFRDAKCAPEDRCREILRRSLAVAPSDAKYPQRQRFSVTGSKTLICDQRVLRTQDRECLRQSRRRILRNDGTGCAGFSDWLEEIVSIKIFAAQRHKQLT